MSVSAFGPMSVGQILDRTFNLYRANFARFLAIVAVIMVPINLIQIGIQLLALRLPGQVDQMGRPLGQGTEMFLALLLGNIFVILVLMVGQSLSNGALIKSTSDSYLGRDVSVGHAYRMILPRLGTLIWASFLVAAVTGLGFMLCVVPGVIFSLWFCVTIPAVVAENRTATDAMTRSKKLVAGNLGKAFVLGLVVVLIGFLMGGAAQLLGRLVGGFTANPVMALFLVQLFALIAQVLATPIGAIAFILFYYDLRIRKEAFDLEMMSAAIEGTEPGIADAGTPMA